MNYNKHSDLVGQHAFLSPSKWHWLNYTDDQLVKSWISSMAAERGTRLHELACACIRDKIRLQRNHCTLNAYVNDAIGYGMMPEQLLYYSDNCFGTTDAILHKNGLLRIHDLKTGTIVPGHMEQLMIYAALYCLENHIDPARIKTELRIYQNDEVKTLNPDPEEIRNVSEIIIDKNKKIEKLKEEGVYGYAEL